VNGQPRRVPAVLVPSGKGGDPLMFPLTPEGEDVARNFIRVDAFWRPPEKAVDNIDPKLQRKPRQTWSCPSAYKRIVAAAKAIGEPPFTVYAIKHSFARAAEDRDRRVGHSGDARARRHQEHAGLCAGGPGDACAGARSPPCG
jgi:integrase